MKFGLLPSVTLRRLLDAILGAVVLPDDGSNDT
jgi:hypothetical protein